MLPLIVVLPLSLFIWFCSVAILSMAIACGAMAVIRFAVSIRQGWDYILGSVIGLVVWGFFVAIVGNGAMQLGGAVVDGLIQRLL